MKTEATEAVISATNRRGEYTPQWEMRACGCEFDSTALDDALGPLLSSFQRGLLLLTGGWPTRRVLGLPEGHDLDLLCLESASAEVIDSLQSAGFVVSGASYGSDTNIRVYRSYWRAPKRGQFRFSLSFDLMGLKGDHLTHSAQSFAPTFPCGIVQRLVGLGPDGTPREWTTAACREAELTRTPNWLGGRSVNDGWREKWNTLLPGEAE
jgi:hypothetical protein